MKGSDERNAVLFLEREHADAGSAEAGVNQSKLPIADHTFQLFVIGVDCNSGKREQSSIILFLTKKVRLISLHVLKLAVYKGLTDGQKNGTDHSNVL